MENGWVGGSWLAQAGDGGEAAGQQGEAAQQENGQGAPARPDLCPPSMFIPIGIVFVLFYLIVLRPQRRQEQQRRELLTALKKNDRVVTIGGIYGVVTKVSPEQDEVTLRVDDENNTKLRVSRSSIQRVITPETEQKDNS